MFSSPNIAALVQRRIKQRIKDAQATYDVKAKEIDREAEVKKSNLVGELVDQVLGVTFVTDKYEDEE